MAKYDVTYSCGHDGVVSIFGPGKDREWKLRYEEEKLCPDCYKKHLEQEQIRQNEASAKVNQEAGLPSLSGSEKQIAWAETIRANLLREIEKVTQSADRLSDPEEYFKRVGFSREVLAEATESIKQRTSASWWIDNRNATTRELYKLLQAELEQIQKEKTAPPAQIIADAQIEATVRPEKTVTETVAEISISNDTVKVHFLEKRDDFREAVKGLKFSWVDGHWKRKIKNKNGTPEDRAAEVGHHLLAKGFV
ncbi:MAG: hypothetical protein PHD46_05785, partial [Eubacteriales bacterium]|nr:hypothetical protein [Eubacteriales bacterium]